MDLFIYSDESGVFDKNHNNIFVFGGIIFLSRENRDLWSRKYTAAEKVVREREQKTSGQEVKAATVTNENKGKLYRSLNNTHKFGVIIHQQQILDSIYSNKKSKQRYLDYAYKIAVKRKFEDLIQNGIIDPDQVEHLLFYVDEHTTATDGLYELRESLEQEFRYGTFSMNYSTFYPPIFSGLKEVQVTFCNSASKTLVRAADIVSNRIFYLANTDNNVASTQNLFLTHLP